MFFFIENDQIINSLDRKYDIFHVFQYYVIIIFLIHTLHFQSQGQFDFLCLCKKSIMVIMAAFIWSKIQ